jgi:RNA polymerase sigma-70 factor, ECF subfamily
LREVGSVSSIATRSGAGPSDAALVVAARGGEEWASEALFRRHAPALNGLAFRLMGRDADVDDLVQETFARAFVSLSRLKEPQAFAAWLRSILVRAAFVTLRRRRLFARLGFGWQSFDVDVDTIVAKAATPDEALELRQVYVTVSELPADLRLALVLRRIEELPLEEIAALTGASIATVKRRVARAELALREKFDGGGG